MGVVVAGIWLVCRRRLSPERAAGVAVALIAVDLLALGYRFHPTMPRHAVLPMVPEIALVRADPGLFRVAGLGDALTPNAGLLYGLQDVRGYDGMTPLAHAQLLGTVHETRAHIRIEARDATHLLDLLNVRYVFANGAAELPSPQFTRVSSTPESTVFRNEHAMPRAFLVDRVMVAPAAEALESDPPAGRGPAAGGGAGLRLARG